MLSTARPSDVINTVPPDRDKLVTFITGKRRRLLIASVNLVYDMKPRRYAEDNKAEFNCRLRTGKFEAEVSNNIKDCRRGNVHVLLKLTTDRHEASRGLYATAELLVVDILITG